MGNASHSSKRKKKRSQKRSKKSSRSIREKSKKLKRRRELLSSSDEDLASTSSQSSSGHSMDEGYRSKRRARSRDRKHRKGRKRKVTRGSSVSEGSRESPRVKKKKKSRKNRDSDLKKKKRSTKRKREPSVSPSESSDNDNDKSLRDQERKNGKLGKKGSKGKQMGREKSRSISRHSSRSISPCSFDSDKNNFPSEERPIEDYQPKRLKSVIVARTEIEEPEVKEANSESHKDEIIYEYDDYPSRSNDSNDGMNRRESLSNVNDETCEKAIPIENPYVEDVSSDVRTSELLVNQRLGMKRTGEGGTTSSSVVPMDDHHSVGNDINISIEKTNSNPNNLEAMLRQKALDNLLKRQGKLPTKILHDEKDSHSSEVRKPSSMKSEPIWHKLDEDGSLHYVQKTGKSDDMNEDNDIHPPISKVDIWVSPEKDNSSHDHMISRPKLGLSTTTKRLLGSSNTWKREVSSHEPSHSNLPMSKETVDIDSAKNTKSVSLDTNLVTEKVDRVAVSEPSPSGGKRSINETNEDDEESEFQQKTMSVMRGGEMVQVSYKVKIPKKGPALARRLLKR